MKPIVAPWIFYIAELADGLKCACLVIGTLLAIAWAICAVLALCNSDYKDDIDYIVPHTVAKKASILAIVCLTIGIFMPAKDTIDKMVIAQNVTYDRVETVGNTVENVYNDIMNLFDKNTTDETTEGKR